MRNILGSHFEESIFEPFCIECETYFVVDEKTCSGESEFCECPKCNYRCSCGKEESNTSEFITKRGGHVAVGLYKPLAEDFVSSGKEEEDSTIIIDKEILIDSLCEEFGITEGKMRRAIDRAMKIKKE